MKIKLSKIRLNKIKLPKLAPNIDKRLSKLTSSIGFYRTLSRISAMEDEGKMLESAKQVIKESRHFKGCADDVINDAANRLIIESKKYKFKNDNYEILNSWYKAIKAFGKAKIPVRSLSPRTVIFYDEVSDFKNFDGFVDKVYKYAVEHKADFEMASDYINELNDAAEHLKFKYKDITIENLDGKDKIRVSIPNSFEKLKEDLKKNLDKIKGNVPVINELAKKYISEIETLCDEIGIDESEKNEYSRGIMGATGQSPTMISTMETSYNAVFGPSNCKKHEKSFKSLFKSLDSNATYKAVYTKGELGDVINAIYFVNSAVSLENAIARMKKQFDKVKSELTQKQQKKNRVATLSPQSKSQSRSSGKVKTLREHFERMSRES